ncbi:H1_5 [Lepeophtheirus salmonis]|uniref:H1_5 n=1 Tax=Lepeophtheirus salmonis TaxID=72036 RepID=A0A7R8D7C0_LEPSM|nr:H1_5 [Lepeophtheirus salmonis]CAF3024411.1 H1_5 [Lepeophtheirus salmonis]
MSVTSPTSITASGKFKDGSKKPKSFMMIKAAIKALADPKGSSLAAIKKYISAHFMVDMVKKSHFICKAIRSAVNKVTKDVKTPKSAKKPDEKKLSKSKSPVKKPNLPRCLLKKNQPSLKSHVKKASKKKTVQSKTPKKTTTKTKTPKKSTTKKTI